MVNPVKQINDAFFAERCEVNVETNCWEWTRHCNINGYGTLKHKRKYWLAHRMMWTHKFGPIEEGKIICHHCDNRRCINPDHLFIGVTQDNVTDKMRKGRFVAKRGEEQVFAKLTEQDVLRIRKDNRTQLEIAAEYGVSRGNIGQIRVGKAWAHVSGSRAPIDNRGTAHRLSKLDDDKVREILNSSDGPRRLLKKYGVSRSLIEQVKNRKIWKHVS